jgi:2-isopropylmalate synthase
MEKIRIYDTTLRDGMQAEGISFSLEDKLLIAKQLSLLGFDYIEGGYALSNPKEMQFFLEAAKLNLAPAKVCGFGNTRRADATVQTDASLNAILACKTPVATLVGKCWDLHVTEVLHCSLQDNIIICAESVTYMKDKGLEVIFDGEHFFDGYKKNPEYALKVLAAVVDAKADVIVLCETNGGCLPNEVYDITKTVKQKFGKVSLGIHCHNDTDCAVANSLAAVHAGARHVQGTINGLGERCGNANLCTIIPNLTIKMGYEVLKPDKIKMLTETSRFVFEIANLPPVTNMPYVGESAFAHKGGLHVDALRKNKKTYEHIDPAVVGNERRFLISELSGKANILAKLEKANIAQDKKLAQQILTEVQNLENKGYQFEAAEASFELLVKKIMGTYKPFFELEKFHITVEKNSGGKMVSQATIKLAVDDKTEHAVSEGDGPVDALYNALCKSLEKSHPNIREMHLIDYKVRIVNPAAGTAAITRVVIETRDKDAIWGTVGVSENIIEASWQALVDSVEYKLIKDSKKT